MLILIYIRLLKLTDDERKTQNIPKLSDWGRSKRVVPLPADTNLVAVDRRYCPQQKNRIKSKINLQITKIRLIFALTNQKFISL